jgi:hypothetical protein
LFRDHRRPAGLRPKAPNPIFSDCSKAQLPGPHSPNHRPECPNVRSTPVPEAFNTHRHDGRGSGLVQDVLRSLARIPAAESRRRGLCAAPANVKRSTFQRVVFRTIGGHVQPILRACHASPMVFRSSYATLTQHLNQAAGESAPKFGAAVWSIVSSPPRQRLQRSVLPSSSAASYRLPSSCAGCSPATPRGRWSAPARSRANLWHRARSHRRRTDHRAPPNITYAQRKART